METVIAEPVRSTTRPLVCLTADCHIGHFFQDFEPYLEARYRPLYREKREATLALMGAHGEPDLGKLLIPSSDTFNVVGEILRPHIVERQHEDRRLFLQKHFGDRGQLSALSTGGEGDPVRQLRELKADGTVGGIALPQAAPFGFGKVEPDLAKAGTDAVNRWAAEYCAVAPDNHAGAFLVSLESGIDSAIEQVRWAAEHGLRGGLLLDTNPEVKGFPLYNATFWDPLWQACEALNVVVNLHAGAGPRIPQRGGQVLWMIDNRWYMSRPLRYFLIGGVFERFPKLKVTMIECNAAWAAEELELLDAVCSGDWNRVDAAGRSFFQLKINHDDSDVDWKVHMLSEAQSLLSRSPSEYFRSNVWLSITAAPDEWAAREALGADRLLWGSDYPHNESTWPHSMEQVGKTIAKLNVSEGDARKIMGGNAADVWGFDLGTLQADADQVGPTFDFQGAP